MADRTYFEIRYTNPRTCTEQVVPRTFGSLEEAREFAGKSFRSGVDVTICQMVERLCHSFTT